MNSLLFHPVSRTIDSTNPPPRTKESSTHPVPNPHRARILTRTTPQRLGSRKRDSPVSFPTGAKSAGTPFNGDSNRFSPCCIDVTSTTLSPTCPSMVSALGVPFFVFNGVGGNGPCPAGTSSGGKPCNGDSRGSIGDAGNAADAGDPSRAERELERAGRAVAGGGYGGGRGWAMACAPAEGDLSSGKAENRRRRRAETKRNVLWAGGRHLLPRGDQCLIRIRQFCNG